MSTILIVLLTLLLPINGQLNSSTARWVDATQCTITYQGHQGNITFLRCTTLLSKSQDWLVCKVLCCPNSQMLPDYPSQRAIQECTEVIQEQGKFTPEQLSLLVLFLSIIGISTLFCLCKTFCKRRDKKVHLSLNEQINNRKQITSLKWIETKPRAHCQPYNSICSICLQENTPVQLLCGHKYHIICIGQWLNKRSMCPSCRFSDIKQVRILCNGCNQREMTCPAEFIKARSLDLPKLCQNCSKNESEDQCPVINISRKSSNHFFMEESIVQLNK